MEDPASRRFAQRLAIGVAILVAVPFIYGYLAKPPGSTFLGVAFATDDAMVYSAWMRQAMDGRFLFDNRFAVDPQPGLTLHLYFLVLGWLAKVIGIPAAMALARSVLSGLFVWLAYKLIHKLVDEGYAQKLALSVVVFGGGLGFLTWHQYGQAFTKASPLSGPLMGRLPVDVWQTEGFVFPSMLVNGLFVAALCLIVGIFLCVLEARESWKPVPIGALCFLLLMNIHSYDVLLVALVLLAFLGASVVAKRATAVWVVRTVVMGLGAIPPALWFIYVLKNDPVFQARAATETYSANFRVVLLGYFILIALSIFALSNGKEYFGALLQRQRFGLAALGAGVLILFVVAGSHTQGYWMGMPAWALTFAAAIAIALALCGESDGRNMVVAWGVVGLVAPYFPALFERKLSMGLAVPWAALAGVGLAAVLAGRERGVRNLVAVFGLALLSGTSVQWFFRELSFIRGNVSNTTVHALYITPNVRDIFSELNKRSAERRVVLAMPGIAFPDEAPDSFSSPYMPDLNPITSGLTGSYSYAGHWSETPEYNQRRGDATRFFLTMSDDERKTFLRENGIGYIIAPVPAAFPEIPQLFKGRALPDLRPYGEVLVDGNQFALIKVTKSS